jgi:indoleamine 2,3-dioxygenase
VATGFLPTKPIPRLTGDFQPWEDLLDTSQSVTLKSEDDAWRAQVRVCPLISADGLQTTQQLRRGHLVLAFLSHRYLHSLPATTERPILPKSIAVPFLAVSERLDLPPVLTYADTVLWNWSLDSPSLGLLPECVLWIKVISSVTNPLT